MPPGTDYVSAFLNHPFPASLLLLLLLALMRLLPIIVLAPFYGAQVLPAPIKMGLGLALAILFMPQLISLTPGPLNFDVTFILLALKELLIGLLIGYFVTIPFSIAGMAGIWIDHQRGVSSFVSLDPTLQAPVSPLGKLYSNTMIYTFFLVGGYYQFLDAVSLSFEMAPPASLFSAAFLRPTNVYFWTSIIKTLNQLVMISVQLSAPAVVTMFMSDLFLGVVNRLAPQVPMAFLGWALKSLLGIAVVWAGWLFIARRLNEIGFDWLQFLTHILRSFKVA
jgi:type III secretion protein T